MNNTSIRFHNPPSLPDTRRYGFSQIAKVLNGKIAMISGQVGWDTDYQVSETGLGKQTEKALDNIRLCLKELEAEVTDILKLNIFITNYSQKEYSDEVHPRLLAFVNPEAPPLMTLLGVEQLARPDFRIEIEALLVVAE